jgi:hypothetical protein
VNLPLGVKPIKRPVSEQVDMCTRHGRIVNLGSQETLFYSNNVTAHYCTVGCGGVISLPVCLSVCLFVSLSLHGCLSDCLSLAVCLSVSLSAVKLFGLRIELMLY